MSNYTQFKKNEQFYMKGLFVMRDQISENKVELQRAVSHQLNKFIFPVLMQGILS